MRKIADRAGNGAFERVHAIGVLTLGGIKITDTGLTDVEKLSGLVDLSRRCVQITADEGLLHLSGMELLG